MFGALAGAVALSALAWFLLIGPQRDATVGVEDETVAAEGQVVVEQRKLARLNTEFADSQRFAAELAANRQALPLVAATGDLLRELQNAGEAAGVTVPSLSAGSPVELKENAGVASVTITIAAVGQMQKLQRFLDQIQRIQPRAMLVYTVTFAPNDSGGSLTGATSQLTVSAQIFVALHTASGSTAPATTAPSAN
ncbi:type 4a pilus biogenesis protein PilO [Virgisporangium ochraceum]|nr:type 4a pilus biogenesis protein PilO [Virgisporangium ochraceum]